MTRILEEINEACRGLSYKAEHLLEDHSLAADPVCEELLASLDKSLELMSVLIRQWAINKDNKDLKNYKMPVEGKISSNQLLKMAARCNCESSKCEHEASECKGSAGDKKLIYVGAVCDKCAKKFDAEDFQDHPKNKKSNMSAKNQLLKLAEELESPENETLIVAEENGVLDKVAFSFMKAADAIREAVEDMVALEPVPEALTPQKLDEIAAVAEAFAESDDELLQKQAAVLDDLLLTLASPKNSYLFSTADYDDRIEQLKKKYNDTRESQLEGNHIAQAVKDIEKSPVYKEYRVMEEPLSTRYCPDHAGVSTYRVGEHTVRCALDGKSYNWDEGFTTQKGNKVPGSTVQEQNASDHHNTFTTFDSRATRMGFFPGE